MNPFSLQNMKSRSKNSSK